MHITLIIFIGFIQFINGQQSQLYQQCGGNGWTGPTTCAQGQCYAQTEWYSQCLTSCPSGWTCTTAAPTTTVAGGLPIYSQCGGIGYTGNTVCSTGQCYAQTQYYSQCLTSCPSGWVCDTSSTTTAPATTTAATTTKVTTTAPATTTAATTTKVTTTAPATTTAATTTKVTTTAPATTTAAPTTSSSSGGQQIYGQCGGTGWTGPTTCSQGQCYVQSQWYSQCLTSCPSGWQCSGGATTTVSTSQSTSTTISSSTVPTQSANTTFPNCQFRFGVNYQVNAYDYSNVDYIAIWAQETFNIYWHGVMVDAAKQYNKIPLFYGYITAFLARNTAGWYLQDCDVAPSGPSLCIQGADFIRQNYNEILNRYKLFANGVATRNGDKNILNIWLIEPDFWQYYGDTRQQNGPLSGPFMRQYFEDIVAAVRSELPNALFSWDISAWIGQTGMQTWWGYFSNSTNINFIHTSGGQAQATSDNIKPNELTYSFMSSLTGRRIIADTGYGVGGSSQGHSTDWDTLTNIQARMTGGVISVTQANPISGWDSTLTSLRAATNTNSYGLPGLKLC